VLDTFLRHDNLHSVDLPGLAMLFSSQAGATAMDAAKGQTISPFAMAFCNGLARSEASVKDIARLVRDDVEDITEQRQTPLLLTGAKALNRSLLTPRQDGAAAAGGAFC